MIDVKISQHELKVIREKLEAAGKNAAPVLKKAINETAKQTVPALASKAQEKYVIKDKGFKRSLKIKKASASRLTAEISCTGEVNELIDFLTTPKRPSKHPRADAAKGKVRKESQLKSLEKGNLKAFIARFSNGHVSVVQRVEGNPPARSRLGKRYVKKLLSPSDPVMLGKSYEDLKPDIEAELKLKLIKFMYQALGR